MHNGAGGSRRTIRGSETSSVKRTLERPAAAGPSRRPTGWLEHLVISTAVMATSHLKDCPVPVHDRSSFENLYAGQPRWETGRPQKAILQIAGKSPDQSSTPDAAPARTPLFCCPRPAGHGIRLPARTGGDGPSQGPGRGLNATFQVLDARALRELPDRFDSVIDSGMLHVFSVADRQKYVEGLATVLRPGGRLFLLCFSDAEPGEEGPRRVSRREIEEDLFTGTGSSIGSSPQNTKSGLSLPMTWRTGVDPGLAGGDPTQVLKPVTQFIARSSPGPTVRQERTRT